MISMLLPNRTVFSNAPSVPSVEDIPVWAVERVKKSILFLNLLNVWTVKAIN